MRWVPNFHLSLRVSLPLTIAVLLALPLAGWGQQELRSGKKGVTVPAPITSTSVDADTQALDVAIKAGSITLSGADGAILDGANPTIKATVTGSNALKVDGSAVTQPVSGTVTVQQSTGTNLHMVCDSGCSGSAGFADNSAFTFGTTAVNPIAGVLDDVATNAATENAAAIIRMTAQKALHINIRNNSGTELGVSGAPLRVDPTGTTTQPVSAASLPLPTGASTLAEQQTQTTALQLIDNLPLAQSAATAGQSGVLAMGAVTTAAPTYTTGNTNPISLQTDGSQRVAVTNTPTVTANAGSGTFNIQANASVNLSQYSGSAVGAANAIHVQPGTGANFATTEQSAAAILAGQQSVTASAVALATNTTKEVCVKALLANTINIYVGPSGVTTSTGLELGPGDSYCTRVTNTNALFVIASTTGAGVSWAARN